MAPHVLLVYGSRYGQTARVAHRIEAHLVLRGFAVSVFRGNDLPAGFRLADYDAVLIGASMIVGGYQWYVRSFVRRHVQTLNAVPSGFFSVGGSAGSANSEERAEAARIAQAFLCDSGWRPTLCASVAGAITYTKYNFVLRLIMKRISRKEGVSTDTSRDHEYTDWSQVEQFAASFAFLVLASPRTTARDEAGHSLAAS